MDFGHFYPDNKEDNFIWITVKGLLVFRFSDVYWDRSLWYCSFNLWFHLSRNQFSILCEWRSAFTPPLISPLFARESSLFLVSWLNTSSMSPPLTWVSINISYFKSCLSFPVAVWLDNAFVARNNENLFFLIGVLMEQSFVTILSEMNISAFIFCLQSFLFQVWHLQQVATQ